MTTEHGMPAESVEHVLAESIERVFADIAAASHSPSPPDGLPSDQWSTIEDAGVVDVLVPEAAGGYGGSWQDAFLVFNLAGLHAIAMPAGETLLARGMLAAASIDVPAGAATLAIADKGRLQRCDDSDEWRFHGILTKVPCAGPVRHVVVACPREDREENNECVALLSLDSVANVIASSNAAGEARHDLHFDGAPALAVRRVERACERFHSAGALLRTAQISGALEAALQLSVLHASERVQFGKQLAKFQAIQQQLAVLAEQTAAVKCAALAAHRAMDLGDARFEIAAAKLRANRAIGTATAIAHEVHGAIGFTQEHRLHHFTQRLWSWRVEFGNDRYWANELGALVLAQGADALWRNLTRRGDR